nr:MAG TPA: hypothetical protein [Caudoviricetes sp.]
MGLIPRSKTQKAHTKGRHRCPVALYLGILTAPTLTDI